MSKPAPMLSASDHGSTNASAPPRTSRRSGRPSREEADLLDEQIMEAARLSFTAVGFSATTIERVASQSRSEEHTSELQSLMRISYAVLCLKQQKHKMSNTHSP